MSFECLCFSSDVCPDKDLIQFMMVVPLKYKIPARVAKLAKTRPAFIFVSGIEVVSVEFFAGVSMGFRVENPRFA